MAACTSSLPGRKVHSSVSLLPHHLELPTAARCVVPCVSSRQPCRLSCRATHGINLAAPGTTHAGRPSLLCRDATKPEETAEEALQRRMRESQEVESRVIDIFEELDLKQELATAGNKLVVLEIQSESVCQTGITETPELHWTLDQKAAKAKQQAACTEIKHVFQRTARECSDVKFLNLAADSEEGAALCDKLGIAVLPALQFYKNGALLWQHQGTLHMEQNMGEGVLYYGNTGANGVRATDFIDEIRTRADLDKYISAQQDEKVLSVLDVCLTQATPCIKVYPAVLALSRSFKGFATFARLLGDTSDETQQLLRDLNIIEVPTFIFYRGGREVGRHVGSSRGDLIGQILQQQANAGVQPPPPTGGTPRRRKVGSKKARV